MKRLLLSSIITLISFNLSAIEHVIGFSGGWNLQKSKLRHTITNRYNNPSYVPPPPNEIDGPDKPFSISKFFVNDSTSSSTGKNFDIEYQLRANFLTLGFGYANNKASIKTNYQNIEDIEYNTNTPYFLLMLSPFDNKYVGLGFGFTLGTETISNNYESNTRFHNSFLVDLEYKVTNHIMIFSRASYLLTKGKDYYLETNLIFDDANNSVIYEDVSITNNHLTITPIKNLYKINFGIRYKI